MRHQVAGKHLGRTSSHRLALRRNMAASLFEHGTISTTIEKAKYVRSFAEKLITIAKKGDLHARRRVISLMQNRDICVDKDGETVKVTTVVQKLFSEIAPLMKDRPGGYTRIVRLPYRRIGDNGELCLLQLVGEYNGPKAKSQESAPQAASAE
ncbi:MAG: 50S ribosomal protein L17 [Sedimentisphaerales bacterium]|nr:50S ribosomal protein L17 [Sedimentisphaerales bacterium]